MKKRVEILKSYLIETEGATAAELEEVTAPETTRDEITTVYGDYLVLTDEEAEAEARATIIEELWAFKAEFILEHTAFYEESNADEDREFIKSLTDLQGRLCEGSNSIVKALIKDLDGFITDAIDADGRGQFLNRYDGEEQEFNGFYIYRTN